MLLLLLLLLLLNYSFAASIPVNDFVHLLSSAKGWNRALQISHRIIIMKWKMILAILKPAIYVIA